jgi:hypothetical protein
MSMQKTAQRLWECTSGGQVHRYCFLCQAVDFHKYEEFVSNQSAKQSFRTWKHQHTLGLPHLYTLLLVLVVTSAHPAHFDTSVSWALWYIFHQYIHVRSHSYFSIQQHYKLRSVLVLEFLNVNAAAESAFRTMRALGRLETQVWPTLLHFTKRCDFKLLACNFSYWERILVAVHRRVATRLRHHCACMFCVLTETWLQTISTWWYNGVRGI